MISRDIIWITLESTRFDHTSLSNYHHDTTPTLASLASDGAGYTKCYSHDIWTRSSSASMLTGHAPSAHQVWHSEARLSEKIKTFPESLQESGYYTACISPNAQLSQATGLDRGFEEFHYLSRDTLIKEAGYSTFVRWLLNIRNHSAGFERDGNAHCIGYFNNQIAKRKIDHAAQTDTPLFLYVHHGDSHHAYCPPVSWRNQFKEDLPMSSKEAIRLALTMTERLHEHIAQKEPFTKKEWQTLEIMYDTVIRYVDYLVSEIVNYARDKLDDPIIIITADHGELFGEFGLLAHMLVTHSAVSHIPLVIAGLNDTPDTSALIQPADVLAMLATDLDLPLTIPAGQDIRTKPREIAITQRGGKRARAKLDEITRYNPNYDTNQFHTGDLTSLRTKNWVYQKSKNDETLYSLPNETRDVSGDHLSVVDDLENELSSWIKQSGQPVDEQENTAQFSKGMKKQLRDLGYL